MHSCLQNELVSRQKKGLIDRTTLVLAIEDPARDVGSGGATLNALYVTAEHLGARQVRTLTVYFRRTTKYANNSAEFLCKQCIKHCIKVIHYFEAEFYWSKIKRLNVL